MLSLLRFEDSTSPMSSQSEVRTTTPELELTVVMPCLNEVATVGLCVTDAWRAFANEGINGEVIVADNGSTDGSQAAAERAGARVVTVSAKGYGSALRGGIAAARGRWVVMGDADASYDFGELGGILAKLREGNDLVMGNRFRGRILPGAMPWKNRHVGNPVLSLIGRVLFRVPAGDFHCGLRGFSVEAYQRMGLCTTGMEFASEMVIKACKLGQRISEVPVTLRPDGRGRPPHLRPWRDGWRHLRFMLLFSPRWLFLYPGLAAIVLGGVLGVRLLMGPLMIGRVALDVHTLVYATAAMMLGVQSVGFGLCAKAFAVNSGLVKAERGYPRFLEHPSLEGGLIAGGLLMVAGFALSVAAVWQWLQRGFGPLDPREMLRWVIPAAMCLMLGGQVILFSFFLGVLGLKLDRSRD